MNIGQCKSCDNLGILGKRMLCLERGMFISLVTECDWMEAPRCKICGDIAEICKSSNYSRGKCKTCLNSDQRQRHSQTRKRKTIGLYEFSDWVSESMAEIQHIKYREMESCLKRNGGSAFMDAVDADVILRKFYRPPKTLQSARVCKIHPSHQYQYYWTFES